jgi:hypothetical protein
MSHFTLLPVLQSLQGWRKMTSSLIKQEHIMLCDPMQPISKNNTKTRPNRLVLVSMASLMKAKLNVCVLTGIFYVTAGMLASASSQPAPVQYRIVWQGPKNTALSGAYTVFEENGTINSKAFTGQFPMEVQLSASPTASITASGASPTDTHIRVRIYQNGKVCDEAYTYGKGYYATVDCSLNTTGKQ